MTSGTVWGVFRTWQHGLVVQPLAPQEEDRELLSMVLHQSQKLQMCVFWGWFVATATRSSPVSI